MREVHLRLLQFVTGIFLFFLVGLHLLFVHFDLFGTRPGEPTSWTAVAERAGSLSWLGFYIALLAVGLYHGIFGLRAIVSELPLPSSFIKLLNIIIILIGLGLFAYGVYIPVSAY